MTLVRTLHSFILYAVYSHALFSHQTILIITLKAGANITSGSIQGISSMYRAGNITLRKGDKGFYLTTDLGVKSLTALLEGNLYVLSKSFSDPVIVTADMKGLRVKAVIFQAFGDTTNATLHEFKITNIDIDASARIPGSSVLSWALGKLVTLVKKFFKEKIDHLIENKAKEVVGRVLQKHHLPLI
ncbi:hypothetical protein GQR58_017776 [Nymphon striatum]|nr:hypothetical protein GQR58_017776 [Nymphon striatum]